MDRLDLKKTWKHLYSASAKHPVLVEVPVLPYLMIDGTGDPNLSPSFQHAVEALFSLSYTLKFMIKRSPGGVDYAVMPLEGLWWADDPEDFLRGSREGWKWTLMILQPDMASEPQVETAREQAAAKKVLPALSLARFERWQDGLCAQVLHVGPFDQEGPTIARLHAYIHEQGLELRGKHREIYLSDFRRTDPGRLRTIIRQPASKP